MSPAMPKCEWVWNCQIHHAVDGDTIDVIIDCGFRATRTERVRLLGINCPEKSTPEGKQAFEFTDDWIAHEYNELENVSGFIIQTHKTDAFGRYLGTLWRNSDGRCLNNDLIEAGHAVPYKR